MCVELAVMIWTSVGLTYKFLTVSLRPRAIQHTVLQFHLSVRCSVLDVLPSTLGVMRVCSRHYTRITPGVMRWCRTACTLMSLRMWLCGLWYVCSVCVMFHSAVCHITHSDISHTNIQATHHYNLLCIVTVWSPSPLAHKCCSLACDPGRRVVDRRHYAWRRHSTAVARWWPRLGDSCHIS